MVLLVLLLVTSCVALPQDLSNKMFTFPQDTNTAHVRLTTSRQDLRAVTVCFRYFTDLKRQHALFALSLPSADNGILIYKASSPGLLQFWVKNKSTIIEEQDYRLNRWSSICSTWDADSGLGQMWVDGKPSSRKYIISGSNVNGPMIIVLGQDQDNFGGGFDITQSFVGMMSDVHMWDRVLSPCEIQNYVDNYSFNAGNVLNWKSLEFQIVGRVLVENKQNTCQKKG